MLPPSVEQLVVFQLLQHAGLVHLLLPLVFLLPWAASSALNCHATCVCASNIVSCSRMNLTVIPTSLPLYTAVLDMSYNSIGRLRAEWTAVELKKLHSLLLSHNGLTFISTEAFTHVRCLRYLDLSSNALRQLDEFIFEQLEQLEVLLLYNNHISQIDRTAFSGLKRLQKLYLSQNQISRFPLEVVKEKTQTQSISLLDVSSNRIKSMSIPDLNALPAYIKNGLYFHNNPVACSCDLHNMLVNWHLRHFSSAVDFKDDYTCVLPGPQKTTVGVFDLNRDYLNCSTFKADVEVAYLNQKLVLKCDTRQRGMSKTWILPGNLAVMSDSNHTAVVQTDGSLKIEHARAEDSGVYTCFASSEVLNETLYISVKVNNFTMDSGHEPMNTAYTTLVGCLASVVLVLIYLYLTPCHCPCCRERANGRMQREDSIHSSMLSATPTHGEPAGRAGLARSVAFIDPKELQGQNGKLSLTVQEDTERGKVQRKKSDAESISSVCSDTPIVV